MRNAGKRCSTTSAPCGAALPPLERSSSPDGVPPRFSPKGVIVPKAQLQARLPGTWSLRVLPAIACPSPASTSRPGHNAGRLMPKPPGRGLQVRPRAPPSLLWPGMPPDHVLHVSEDAYVTDTGTFVKGVSLIKGRHRRADQLSVICRFAEGSHERKRNPGRVLKNPF